MASDHEIEVLNGLIAAMMSHAAIVRSSTRDEDVRAGQLRALNGRMKGLNAQVVALGGVSNGAASSSIDGAGIVPDPPGRADAGDAAQAGISLPVAFRSALDDREIGASTRAAINTAWSFLETAFSDTTSIRLKR